MLNPEGVIPNSHPELVSGSDKKENNISNRC